MHEQIWIFYPFINLKSNNFCFLWHRQVSCQKKEMESKRGHPSFDGTFGWRLGRNLWDENLPPQDQEVLFLPGKYYRYCSYFLLLFESLINSFCLLKINKGQIYKEGINNEVKNEKT